MFILERMILGACFGPGPFALDTAIDTTTRGSFWNLTFSKRRVGVKKKRPRDVSPDKIDN